MAAYTLPPLQCIRSCFPSINCSCPEIRFSSVSSSSSELRSHSIFMNGRRAILPVRTRASSEGAPSELVEDPKFVPLNADDPVFGPPALFLMGFDLAETSKMQKFLKELDGEFLKIILCTEDMLNQSIWDAIHTEHVDLKAVKVAKSVPRICFLSGLSGEEMMMFIDAFPEIGLRPAVFAALVPNSTDKLVKDVAEEIMGDHEMLSAKQRS
ncbi:uncharacterized protein LOC110030454 isoform X1 [Phalaenopsis equestris]|uniref:uncharacterized protein LOC110030454 isoform X1 n=1 Tax=Phalaenopsis equestris TaxID=78828 RepID=UPI0009E63BC5|nr:uncharacterized protein LOC110030454 isoform X1 [Phalaenopsis equestris]